MGARPAAMVSGLALNVPPPCDLRTTLGVECGHDVGASGKGADRKATADRLAERGEVGADAIGGTEAAEGEAERDDLVDDHERAVAGSELADSVDELRVGGLEASAVRHEVDEDRGNIRTARIEELPKRRTVALREH